MLLLEELKRLLDYDENTGLFTWLVAESPRIKVGSTAGSLTDNGYIRLGVRGRLYLAHVLAVFYKTGEWPAKPVDHRNLIKHDNSYANLRLATHVENGWNKARYKCNSTGFKGVSFNRGRYEASARYQGKRKYLGRYDTPEEAAEAYNIFCKNNHGDFCRLDLVGKVA